MNGDLIFESLARTAKARYSPNIVPRIIGAAQSGTTVGYPMDGAVLAGTSSVRGPLSKVQNGTNEKWHWSS